MFKDSFAAGVVYGLVASLLALFSIIYFDNMIFIPEQLHQTLYPPKLQLLLLAICMILFRLMMVNWKHTKAGRAFLFVIIVSALIMFFKFR